MTDLVLSLSIENLVNQRAAVMERLEKAINLLSEAKALAEAAHVGFPKFTLDSKHHSRCMLDPDDIADTMSSIGKDVDGAAWQYLMSESGIRSFMDATTRRQWDQDIEHGKMVPLTAENVSSTFRSLYGARGDMFDQGVIAVFKGLSWDYKTNRPFGFGKRLIIGYLTSTGIMCSNGFGFVNHDRTDKLDDLSRVFHVLDSKPEPDHRQGCYHMVHEATNNRPAIAENDYFSIRCHKNGNGHVTFKRPDLVAKMNQILMKHFPGALAFDTHTE